MDNYDGYVKIGTKIDDKDLKPQLQKTKTNILSTMKTIGIGTAAAAAAVAGFVKIAGELNKAYMVQASAERALATAAKNNPYLNDRSIQKLKAYASELQKVSNYGDEVTIGLMAQLAAAGRTEAEIQKIIKASADLAASGTTTFDGAVRNLNKTFSGLSGELGEVIPELKNLTAEQMKNGDAVDLIAKKYDGMALSVVDKSMQAKNALGDLSEQMGRWLSPVVDWLSSSFGTLAAKMAEVLSAANDLRDAKKAVDEGTGTAKDKIIIYQNQIEAIKYEMSTLIAYDELGQKIYTQAYKDKEEEIKQIEEAIKKEEKLLEIEARLAHAKSIGAKDAAAQAEKELAIQKEAGEKERKQIDGRIAAQQQYEAAVNLATEKQKGGLITLEEKWDDIKSAASAYTDALINLGYTYEETATIGGKALDDMRRKLTGNDLSKGLGFTSVIGGEGATGFNNIINGFTSTLNNTGNIFLNSIKKVIIDEPLKAAEEASKEAIAISARATAEAAKQTANKANKESANIAKIYKDKIIEATEQVKQLYEIASAAMADGNVELYQKAVDSMKTYSEQIEEYKIKVSAAGRGAVNSIESAFSDNVNSAVLVVKDFTKNVAGAFSAGLSIAKNVVSGIFTAIKAMATFSPKEIIDDIKKTIEGLTDFFTKDLPLLPVYFKSGAEIIREFINGMLDELPKTTEIIQNTLSEIFEDIKKNIKDDATSALTVASALLLAIVSALPEAIETIGAIASAIIKAIVTIAPELIKGIVEGLIEILPEALDTVIEFLEEWWDTIPDLAGDLVEVIVGMVPDLVSLLIESIPKILKLMNPLNAEMVAMWMTILAEILPDLFVLPINIWTGIIDGIATLLIGVLDEMVLFLDDPEAWADMKLSFIENMAKALIEAPEKIWDKVKSAFMGLIDKIGGLFSGLGYVLEKALKLDLDGDGVIGDPANGGTTGGTTGWTSGEITGGTTGGTGGGTGGGTIGGIIEGIIEGIKIPPLITTPTKELPTASITIGTGNLATESRQIKVLKKILGVPTEFASEGKQYNAVTLPVYLRQKGLNALQIAALLTTLKNKGVASYATGTSFAEGGLSKINEPYSELVELPTGSKVMTANATAGLVEQAVQSVMRGLGGFEVQQNQRPIVLHNYMESVMNVNGKVLGKIAFENIDRNVRMQYGS